MNKKFPRDKKDSWAIKDFFSKINFYELFIVGKFESVFFCFFQLK